MRHRAWLQRYRRHVVVIGAVAALAAGVALAHSAAANDHMTDGMTVCLALAGSAALGAMSIAAVGAFGRSRRSWLAAGDAGPPHSLRRAAPPLPWSRGSPVYLQVLRL